MTTYRRIIRPVPSGISPAPEGAMLVDGYLDYLEAHEAVLPAAPANAIYVCKIEDGITTVEKDTTSGVLVSKHSFAGWPEPEAAK